MVVVVLVMKITAGDTHRPQVFGQASITRAHVFYRPLVKRIKAAVQSPAIYIFRDEEDPYMPAANLHGANLTRERGNGGWWGCDNDDNVVA